MANKSFHPTSQARRVNSAMSPLRRFKILGILLIMDIKRIQTDA